MRVIGIGDKYEIYGDGLKTYDKLPANTYTVRFDNMSGFYLERHSDIEIKEEKVYGVHLEKVEKVLNSFWKFNRNLGVILSGDKGIGKSLFAKMLGVESVKRDIPVIIVESYIPGIASYIESIEQEVMILFDEFDKTFGDVKRIDGDTDPQASLLSLFDGTASGKKLFVITCNRVYNLNDYLVNRPGRFHYHMRFDYPNSTEIKEYLMDNLEEEYYKEIDKVLSFSSRVNLNYDCLRAIVFELNMGTTFSSAIKDLNILNMGDEIYDVKLHFEDGLVLHRGNCNLDFFSSDEEYSFSLLGGKYDYAIDVRFRIGDGTYNEIYESFIFNNGKYIIEFEDSESYKEEVEDLKNRKPKFLSVSKHRDKRFHFTV